MGDGTKENPYTREDVLRLKEENGGTAEGLDLSNCKFVEAIDLSDLDLSGIVLNGVRLFRANFNGSNLDGAIMQKANLGYATFNPLKSKAASLQGVDLRSANLHDAEFREANLASAQFQETEFEGVVHPPQLQGKVLGLLPASLERTDFSYANLFRANFKGCFLYGTKLEGAYIRGADIFDAHIEEADWGNYKIGEEKSGDFYSAENIYRRLKIWYTNAGIHNTAAEFYYREKEARRKSIQNIMHMLLKQRECRKLLKLLLKQEGGWTLLWLWIYRLLCGYGEKTLRIIGWAAFVIFGSALIYFLVGSTWEWGAFWSSLYFSAVSFTALGYGSWLWTTNDWIKGIGAFESFIGVFTMALFLITFVRKMTR